MSHVLPDSVRNSIATSRKQCLAANFQGALETLSSARADSVALLAEMARVHMLRGDYRAAKEVCSQQWPSGDPLHMRLLRTQKAYIEIITDCKLAEAINIAREAWDAVGDAIQEDVSEVSTRIICYCLEIFGLILEYGNRTQIRDIPCDEIMAKFLAVPIVHRLSQIDGLVLESLGLVERFIHPDSAEVMLSEFLEQEIGAAKVGVSLLLLRIQAESCDLGTEELETSLAMVEESAVELGHKTGVDDVNAARLRFDKTQNNAEDRIRNMLSVSQRYFERGYFEKSIWVLEAATEVHCELPPGDGTTTLGVRLHDSLQQIHQTCGDQLSLLEVQFRKCNFLNSLTPHLASARHERALLLQSRWCREVPTFRRFHKRQWEECLMLNQAEDALYHAKGYFEYSEDCLNEAEQSLARTMIFETSLNLSKRMSVEAREDRLQSLQSDLEGAIEADNISLGRLKHELEVLQSDVTATPTPEPELTGHAEHVALEYNEMHAKAKMDGFFLSKGEKYLLKFEIVEELRRMGLDEKYEMADDLLKILEQGEESFRRVGEIQQAMAHLCEIRHLRTAVMLFGKFDNKLDDDTTINEIATMDNRFAECYHMLALAESRNSYALFEKAIEMGKAKMGKISEENTLLRRLRLYQFRARLICVLIYRKDPQAWFLWQKAGFETFQEGISLMLQYIEKALQAQELLKDELTQGSKWERLNRAQALFVDVDALDILQDALTACSKLGDPEVTWVWAQRAKARSISDELDKLSGPGYSKTPASPIPSINDMFWIWTATAKNVVFIDWVATSDEDWPFMLVALSFEQVEDGYRVPEFFQQEIRISREDVIEVTDNYKLKLYGPDSQESLDQLQPVISPLEKCSKEGDLLVLCPTTYLHNFPLHALCIGEKTILERNPVVYTPSLAALVQILRRLEAPETKADVPQSWSSAILGTYEDISVKAKDVHERNSIYASLKEIAKEFGDTEVTGPNLSKPVFIQRASSSNLIHFHGHGSYDEHDIERQSLVLAEGHKLTVPEIIQDLELKLSPHVTLIACDAAIQDFSLERDEPLGILTAFLLAGATSVLGSLWPVKSEDGRMFSRLFYDHFLTPGSQAGLEQAVMVNLAVGWQRAALAIRKEKPDPYYWAGYILYGAWCCRRKPGAR